MGGECRGSRRGRREGGRDGEEGKVNVDLTMTMKAMSG